MKWYNVKEATMENKRYSSRIKFALKITTLVLIIAGVLAVEATTITLYRTYTQAQITEKLLQDV